MWALKSLFVMIGSVLCISTFSLQMSLVVLRWLNVAEQQFILFFLYIYIYNFFLSSVYCMYIVLKSHQYYSLFVYLSKMVRICKTGSVMLCHPWRLYFFFLCKVSANDKHWLMYSMRLSAVWLVYRLRSKEKAIIPSVAVYVCLYLWLKYKCECCMPLKEGCKLRILPFPLSSLIKLELAL